MQTAQKIGVLLVAITGLALAPSAASAAKKPLSYNSPGYKGTTTAPKTTAPALPKPIALSTAGDEADTIFGRPTDLLVDEAGTAHIVWDEGNGEGADSLRYCRLKRGATACDNPPQTRSLVPDKPYANGDGPQFNSDPAGPRILRIGNRLVLLTYRFPTSFSKPDPDASLSDTVLAYVSTDGGNSFGEPGIVGQWSPAGGALVFGPDDDPTILTLTGAGVCGICVAALRPGQFSRAVGNLGGDLPNGGRGTDGALALDGALPVAAVSDSATTFVRRWKGSGEVTDPTTWTASTPAFSFPGSAVRLAGGPGGLYAVNRSTAAAVAVRRITGTSVSKPVTVGSGSTARAPALFEGPTGGLATAFATGPVGAGGSINLRTSSDGATWSAPQRLDTGTPNGPIALGAAADGGGFATFDVDKGTPRSRVVAVGFGSQGPTGKTGIAGVPGLPGGDATTGCTKITFGVVSFQSTAGCFTPGKGSAADVLVTGGELNLNGLKIVPDAGVKITIDPKTKEINTTGSVRVLLVGGGLNITLWHGQLHVKLPTTGAGTNLFSFDTKDFPVDLKGFPLQGRIDVILTPTGVRIPVSLGLPGVFGGVTGQATLLVDRTNGLSLDSMAFDVGTAPIGPLVLKNLHIGYTNAGEVWDGSAELDFPGGLKLEGAARFSAGEFDSGSVTATPPFPPGIPLGPGVWLSRVGGGFALKPDVKLTLNGQFGALPVSPKGPFSVVVDGTASVIFGDPITFTFDGAGSLLGIQLSQEHATVNTDGYADFSGSGELDLKVISAKGAFDLAVDGPRKLFSGTLNGNVALLGHDFVDVQGVVSSAGVAGCYKLLFVALGFGYKWGDSLPEIMFPSCDLSAYKTLADGTTPPPGQPPAAIPGTSFTVAPGTPSVSLRATGEGGQPSIVLIDPDGKRITPLALPKGTTEPPADTQALIAAVSDTVAVIGISKPKAGLWKIESAAVARSALDPPGPTARAAALSGVDLAVGLPAPTVSATLGGTGRERTLAYRVTSRKGLVTRFFEKGRGGTRLIGVAGAARGTLRFSTGAGPGGPRTITAALEQDGVPRMRRDVAKYTAPARLAAPRMVKVKDSGSAVTVTWTAAPGAAGYTVRLRATNGATLTRVVPASARSVRFTGIEKRYKVAVTVAGRTRGGRAGRARGARG